jgi:hypothetical protein
MREESRGGSVGTVVMHNVVSVDGFIADENDDVGPLHDTSAASMGSIYWRIPTWSSKATGCYI